MPDAKARRVEDIVRRVEALPRVTSAFASNLVPLSGGGGGANIIIDGQPSEPGKEPGISFIGVTPHFHRTLNVSMKQGRDFTDAEGWSSQPLAIVNETMARRFWPKGPRRRRAIQAGGPESAAGLVHDHRRRAGHQAGRHRSRGRAIRGGVRAVPLSTDVQYRTDDSRGRRSRRRLRRTPVPRSGRRIPICRSRKSARWRRRDSWASGSTACSAGSSASPAWWACCSRRSACMACCRTP